MIPEKGKTYFIDLNTNKVPDWCHYTGTGVCVSSEADGDGYYLFELPGHDSPCLFGKDEIMYEMPKQPSSGLEQILAGDVEAAGKRIKAMQVLLYEAIEYIKSEKVLRDAYEGENLRLDREADELIQAIKEQFTDDELEVARNTSMRK